MFKQSSGFKEGKKRDKQTEAGLYFCSMALSYLIMHAGFERDGVERSFAIKGNMECVPNKLQSI